MRLTRLGPGTYTAKTLDGREWQIVKHPDGLFVAYDVNDKNTVLDPEPLWYVRKCLDQINAEAAK